ncbi:Membrane associated serine protease, rhomboid family [Desulfurobacterium pacificum]|uniref:Membrane associated serine protease, rhomboid family n=1 Tax=Desulfurobacterium pacificum TaxID=240166 RepID=A0ABY1NJ07_9BACT|nr:rhomboid family intramembrane serine protease [Desulfurobacterium pacificum]SMP11069.1 Membrane associated serine protease, rhomboid family [Desulfurobacterium pacificum]
MIPIKDINPSRSTPIVTIGIIVFCTFVFLYELSLGPYSQIFVKMFGVIPYEVFHGVDIPPPDPLTPYGNLVSYQYLHGGFMHIIGNMLFLWVFGDNVEDTMGKLKYFFFYTFCGIVAALIQVLVYPNSDIPLIGASGAISGVLGAYMVFFPRAQIVTLVFIFFIIDIIVLPAALWIAIWFIFQFTSALLSVHHLSMGGVAWFAHLGGFLAGVLVAKFMKRNREISYYRP